MKREKKMEKGACELVSHCLFQRTYLQLSENTCLSCMPNYSFLFIFNCPISNTAQLPFLLYHVWSKYQNPFLKWLAGLSSWSHSFSSDTVFCHSYVCISRASWYLWQCFNWPAYEYFLFCPGKAWSTWSDT